MTGKFQIISERLDSYTGKRGRVEQWIVALLDLDKNAMLNTVDFVLSDEERIKLAGKCVGKTVEMAVTDMKPHFGGRLRVGGQILGLS